MFAPCSVNHSVPLASKTTVCGSSAFSTGMRYSFTSPVFGSSLPIYPAKFPVNQMLPSPSETSPCGPEFVTCNGYSLNSPVLGSSRPILLAICSVNHKAPSAPTAGSCGCAPLVGTAHSLMLTLSSWGFAVSLLLLARALLAVAAREIAKPARSPTSARLATANLVNRAFLMGSSCPARTLCQLYTHAQAKNSGQSPVRVPGASVLRSVRFLLTFDFPPPHALHLSFAMSLFPPLPTPVEPETPSALQPLAERMRPRTLDEFIGQEKLLGPGKPLRVQIESDNLGSMLFWGPPGCGKTTLARLIARLTSSEFVSFSAVLAGIKEIKEVMSVAEHKSRSGHRTIVFVDEVHRFNKAQQDAFLPYVEAGHIIFIGATTENPSFEVISPLLSRTKVYVLDPLTTPQIAELLRRALNDKEHGFGVDRSAVASNIESIEASDEILFRIASFANGDARTAYNTLELAVRSAKSDSAGTRTITKELLEDVLQRKLLRYDKAGEEHFNLISALHKSVGIGVADGFVQRGDEIEVLFAG